MPSRPAPSLQMEFGTGDDAGQLKLPGVPGVRRCDVHGVVGGVLGYAPNAGARFRRADSREPAARMVSRQGWALNAGAHRFGDSRGRREGGRPTGRYFPKIASRVCARFERWSFMRSSSARRIDSSMSSALRMIWGVMKTSRVDIVSCLVRFLNR